MVRPPSYNSQAMSPCALLDAHCPALSNGVPDWAGTRVLAYHNGLEGHYRQACPLWCWLATGLGVLPTFSRPSRHWLSPLASFISRCLTFPPKIIQHPNTLCYRRPNTPSHDRYYASLRCSTIPSLAFACFSTSILSVATYRPLLFLAHRRHMPAIDNITSFHGCIRTASAPSSSQRPVYRDILPYPPTRSLARQRKQSPTCRTQHDGVRHLSLARLFPFLPVCFFLFGLRLRTRPQENSN